MTPPFADAAPTPLESAIVASAEKALDKLAAARAGVASVIFGQGAVVEEALVTILAGGHGLLVGVPGLAKTKLVETLGIVLGLSTQRIQFTPDSVRKCWKRAPTASAASVS